MKFKPYTIQSTEMRAGVLEKLLFAYKKAQSIEKEKLMEETNFGYPSTWMIFHLPFSFIAIYTRTHTYTRSGFISMLHSPP